MLTFARIAAAGAAALLGVVAFAHADPVVPGPRPLTAALVASAGNKAECVSTGSMALRMLTDQGKHGGKTLLLTDGADQDFADRWRSLSQQKHVAVKTVLVHGYVNTHNATIIDVVEFAPDGCAISNTTLTGGSWDTIIDSMSSVNDAANAI